MVCSQSTCSNWIWTDKLRSGTKCRRCGTWWPDTHTHTGKGKGYGRPANKRNSHQQWLETPPGLTKIRPLKKTKVQQEATELLNGSWSTLPEEMQIKLQALGIGPTKPEEPELTDILKTHMDALPPQVQQIVTKLTAPEPCTERDIATKLKGQVTDLKAMSIRKNQLQEKIDGVKAQYASLLSDMQEIQAKMAEGQKALHKLSQDYMNAINQTIWGSRSQKSRRTNCTGSSSDPTRTLTTQPNGGKQMALLRLHLVDLVGNRDRAEQLPGWTFPLPEDDTWSCDGTEEHSLGIFVEQNNSFDDEPKGHQPHTMWINTNGSQGDTHRETCEGDISQSFSGTSMNQSSRHTTRVCRAASGSTAFSSSSATSVGEQTRSAQVEPFQDSSTHQGIPVAGDEQLNPWSREPQQGLPILH